MDYTFIKGPMPKGQYARKKNSPEKAVKRTQERRRKNPLPKWIVKRLRDCRHEEPALDTPQCRVKVYRRYCPVGECEYLSGRYVSHESALKALLGHLRWVHNYG